MSTIVELPNGDTAEFPDEMSENDISSAIQGHLASSQPEKLNPNVLKRIPSALGNVASDVGHAALNLPANIVNGAMNLPSEAMQVAKGLPDVGNQIVNDPKRAGRNVVAGLADIGHGALNTPRSIAEYLSKIGMIAPETAKKVPMQEDISQPLSEFVGNDKQPGDKLLRGIVGNIPNIGLAIETGRVLNPAKLSYKNLADKIVDAEKSMKNKYSGPNGKYQKLSEKAESRGITKANIDPEKIDIDTIKKYTSPIHTAALDNFLENRNLTNAQKSISDLGYIQRRLENKLTLLDPEKDQLKAVKNAKNYIQENMFKDESGKIHQDLLDEHKEIQKGYANEVIPYTKNKAIQNYKKNEKLPKELIQSLSKGKFSAKRGSYHKDIKLRNLLNSAAGSKISQGALIGSGATGAYEMLKSLMGGND